MRGRLSEWFSSRASSIVAVVGACVLLLGAPGTAFAHAHLVRSAPAAGSTVAISPDHLQLWFSEGVELSMTSIAVSGPDGSAISIGAVTATSSDELSLLAPFRSALAPGKYTVTWRAVAKDDGHPSNGVFSFTVSGNVATSSGAQSSGAVTPNRTGPIAAGASGARATGANVASGMDVEAPAYVAMRWLTFAALIAMIGAVGFRTCVIPRLGAANGLDDGFQNRVTPRTAHLGLVAALLFVLSAIGRLYAQRAVVGVGMTLGTVLSSSWGHVLHVQLAAAAVACIAFWYAARTWRSPAAWAIAGFAVVVLAITLALSGHAGAAPAYTPLSIGADVVHVLSAGGWLGTLLVLVSIGIPAAIATSHAASTNRDMGHTASLVSRLVEAFSPAALTFAALVVVSGLIATWLRVGSIGALFSSTYGTILLIKLAFVGLVFAGGAYNWLRMRAALKQGGDAARVARFRRSGWIELGAGILVIVVTALLVAAQPPMQ